MTFTESDAFIVDGMIDSCLGDLPNLVKIMKVTKLQEIMGFQNTTDFLIGYFYGDIMRQFNSINIEKYKGQIRDGIDNKELGDSLNDFHEFLRTKMLTIRGSIEKALS